MEVILLKTKPRYRIVGPKREIFGNNRASMKQPVYFYFQGYLFINQTLGTCFLGGARIVTEYRQGVADETFKVTWGGGNFDK